ncbi:MAG: dihydroorotase [Opitutaceae bacterium]|nr:dihydroorotase [Opitutaceae bacterium]
MLWIQNGRIIDPLSNRDESGDLYAIDGRIVDSLSHKQQEEAHIIDAKQAVVCPGLVDIHVHFREPGQTHKETIESGSWSAAAGGFTSVVCMPNTTPPADNPGTIQLIQNAIKKAAIRVYPSGCITIGMKGEKLASTGSMKKAGVVCITDDGMCIQSNELMRRAVEYANMFDMPVMDHCQDESLTKGSVMNEGVVSTRLGLNGWPASAEDIIVSRNVILSTHTGAHIHLQHISSATSVDIIRRAKQRQIRITAEATPHHLHLTDESLATYDTNFKMNPPLRTEADRQAIIEGIKDGTLDCVATDHAPHTNYEKDQEFDYAPFGIVGLETSLPITLEVLHREAAMSLSDTISLLTDKAAAVLNLEGGNIKTGARADITIFDPDETRTVDPDKLLSKSKNSPWIGCEMKGRVKLTIVGGKIVYDGEKIVC